MTDEDRITELFHAAASDAGAPPSRFDHNDVVAVSRRITARRRSAVIGGAVALLLIAGVGTVAALPRGDTGTLTTAAAPADAGADNKASGPAAAAAAPEAAVGGVPTAGSTDSAGGAAGGAAGGGAAAGGAAAGGGDAAGGGAAAGGSAAGGVAPGGPAPGGVTPGGPTGGGGTGSGSRPQAPGVGTQAHPLGPGTTLCANRQDPALRALVVAVVPEAAHASGAATSDICLPGTQRYLSLELGGGVLTVAYLPPGTVASLAPGAKSAPTASHGTVIVSPAPGYADRVPKLLQYLAPRL